GSEEGGEGHPGGNGNKGADILDTAALETTEMANEHQASVVVDDSSMVHDHPESPGAAANRELFDANMSGAPLESSYTPSQGPEEASPIAHGDGHGNGEVQRRVDQQQQEYHLNATAAGGPESPGDFGMEDNAARHSIRDDEEEFGGRGNNDRGKGDNQMYSLESDAPPVRKTDENMGSDGGYGNADGMEGTKGFGERRLETDGDSVSRSRRMFDGSRIAEPDDVQVVDAGDGADLIAGVDDLPIFANDQSKALNDEIKRLEKKVTLATNALADNRERVQIMEEHLKNVRQEVGHTNALMAAKKKEIVTEEHLRALAAREAGRYTHDAKRFVVEAEEAQDKLNVVQNSIFGANEEMDRFKLQMNWNQEELEQWALAAKQKEEDNLALQKYARADDVKIKELSLQVERLSKSVVSRRAELQNLEAESSAKQARREKGSCEYLGSRP
ncbi:unnamed protein product, partial [Scytosiphon promiscuus]